jgi:hypothetical protein
MTDDTPPSQPTPPPPSAAFPRSNSLPAQSPKYWAKEKDRYLRQLLIRDIEASTGRPLIVYFAQLDQQIGHTDPDDISEIVSGLPSRSADMFIQTAGGLTDATEKIISVLRHSLDDFRVIVPSWAKSAGTVIAIASKTVLMGVNSELGPIDPQFQLATGMVPCELVAKDTAFPQHVRDLAQNNIDRTRVLAKALLEKGMMRGRSSQEIDDTLAKLSSSDSYKSHGAVIDYEEAIQLGLSAEYLDPTSELWRRVWLLYCMYDYDAKAKNLGKIFEGSSWSIARTK